MARTVSDQAKHRYLPLAHMLAVGAILTVLTIVTVSRARENATTAKTLSDINPFSYEGIAALYLQRNGVIDGYPDGTFRGYLSVQRVEAAKMLLLAAKYEVLDLKNNKHFPDIEAKSWYEKFALSAVQHGLMHGYPDGTFGPALTINRAEFLKMLTNAFALEQNIPYSYKDAPPKEWFARYAGIAEKYNLFLYDQERLFPAGLMTRDEVAWAIYQILLFKELGTVVATPFDFVTPFPSPTAILITIDDLRAAAPDATGNAPEGDDGSEGSDGSGGDSGSGSGGSGSGGSGSGGGSGSSSGGGSGSGGSGSGGSGSGGSGSGGSGSGGSGSGGSGSGGSGS
ncbi:MAG: hypothetical protein UY90_C0021G0007, partial [Candidatus Peregrinibacteria bacterium GW2011_GWA2_54_9]